MCCWQSNVHDDARQLSYSCDFRLPQSGKSIYFIFVDLVLRETTLRLARMNPFNREHETFHVRVLL